MIRRRDLRRHVIILAVIGIGVLGYLLSRAPNILHTYNYAPQSVAVSGQDIPPAHDREVRQRFAQAVVMLHAREYDHAVAALHRVLEFAPQMPEAHSNMGFAMLGLERFATARDFFLAALDLRRTQTNAYYGLAVASEALGDRAAARGAMRAYIHLADGDDRFVRRARAALWEWDSGPLPPDGRTDPDNDSSATVAQ